MNFWTDRTLRISLWIVFAAAFFLAVQLFKSSPHQPFASVQRWFILLSYNASKNPVSTEQLAHWDMAVLDADVHPPLASFEKIRAKSGMSVLERRNNTVITGPRFVTGLGGSRKITTGKAIISWMSAVWNGGVF